LPVPELDERTGALLTGVAEAAVVTAIRSGHRLLPDLHDPAAGLRVPPEALAAAALRAPGASFVTLTRDGRLLGCIGALEPREPLIVDVARHALAAAFDDPRMPAVDAADVAVMDIEVSVLGPMVPLVGPGAPAGAPRGYADLLAAVTPGEGLLVAAPGHRATFLPDVWRDLPGRRAFLAALWQKAWLEPGVWPRGISVHRYATRAFTRRGPRPV
jgi:hypothetical protein